MYWKLGIHRVEHFDWKGFWVRGHFDTIAERYLERGFLLLKPPLGFRVWGLGFRQLINA